MKVPVCLTCFGSVYEKNGKWYHTILLGRNHKIRLKTACKENDHHWKTEFSDDVGKDSKCTKCGLTKWEGYY